jgi:DNA-directed RNA polymerase specialized sigma24 family protein
MSRYDRPTLMQHPTNMPSLFDHGMAPVPVAVPSSDSIEASFQAFHQANPWVYRALVQLARDLRSRGRRRIGIGMLFEVLRWQWQTSTFDVHSDFKLNNNYRSRYARMIMENEPELADAFEVRRLTSA